MSLLRFQRSCLVAALTGLLAACASRQVPVQYPRTSAASPDATAATPSDVTQTLDPARASTKEGFSRPTPAAAEGGYEGREERHGHH